MPSAENTVDVLLLHGAWCGAWVWDEVSAALTTAGFRVAAPALPIDQLDIGVCGYVESVLDQLGGQSVGLAVGHSLAGILLEPLAAQISVTSLMYLTAFVPHPGMSLRSQWKRSPALLRPGWSDAIATDPTGTTHWTRIDAAAKYLLNDCPPATATAAAARLLPQDWTLTRDRHEAPLTTRSIVVTATHDRLLNSSELRRCGERIADATFTEIEADHMPMLSRPRQLTELIQRLLQLRHPLPAGRAI